MAVLEKKKHFSQNEDTFHQCTNQFLTGWHLFLHALIFGLKNIWCKLVPAGVHI